MGTSNIARHRHTGVTTFVCVAACCLTLLSGCGGAAHTDPSAGTVTGAYRSVRRYRYRRIKQRHGPGWHGVYRAIRAANQTHLR